MKNNKSQLDILLLSYFISTYFVNRKENRIFVFKKDKNMANKYLLYLDECGDQNLASLDPQFPIFTLCGIIVSEEQDRAIIERINALKKEIWNNINVIFHSRI